MLWMKNWFEMRVKFLFGLLVLGFLVTVSFLQSRLVQGGPAPVPAGNRLQVLLSTISLFFVMQAIMYAGSGIRTQSPFRAMKGIHGSTYLRFPCR